MNKIITLTNKNKINEAINGLQVSTNRLLLHLSTNLVSF